jgi:CheY-like chemotaxis protein
LPVEIGVTSDRFLLSRIYVLVVEDHAHSREFLDEALSYHGAAVIAVESAARAMQILARFKPTIVITDIAMPQHDGLWLLRALRLYHQAEGWYVPVIALTASVRRPLRADFDAILVKPCPMDTLLEMILRLTKANAEKAARG